MCQVFNKFVVKAKKEAPVTTPVLWGVPVSPFVRKVQVVLLEKQLAYELKPLLPTVLGKAIGQEFSEDFQAVSPLGKIPALEDGAVRLADSSVISAYLERRYPGVIALYPTDPGLYARTLWFERYADTVLAKVLTYTLFTEAFLKPNVLKQESDSAVIARAIEQELPPILDYLEKEINAAAFINGASFSIADVAIATHFVSAAQVGYTVDAARWPKTAGYIARVCGRASFAKLAE